MGLKKGYMLGLTVVAVGAALAVLRRPSPCPDLTHLTAKARVVDTLAQAAKVQFSVPVQSAKASLWSAVEIVDIVGPAMIFEPEDMSYVTYRLATCGTGVVRTLPLPCHRTRAQTLDADCRRLFEQ